jgi:NADPH2:quinone reductase
VRAFELPEYDGPQALRSVAIEDPTREHDQLLLEVDAIGINFPDLLFTQGLYQHRPPLPVVPGCEVAGRVLDVPAGSGWQTGDRVAAFVWEGSFAERAVVPVRAAVRPPAAASALEAAAMVVNYHTVHFALARRGQLAAGETLLVLGAAGGVGTAALQVGRGLGARVIAGVRDEEKAAIARAAGADEVVLLEDGFSARVRELTGGAGVDVVLDPVGDWLFDEALRGLRVEGRLLVVGFAAGGIPRVKVNRLLLRNVSVVGVAFGAILEHDEQLMVVQAAALDTMFDDGHVRPQLSAEYRFEQLPDALEDLAAGRIAGRGVVAVTDGQMWEGTT